MNYCLFPGCEEGALYHNTWCELHFFTYARACSCHPVTTGEAIEMIEVTLLA